MAFNMNIPISSAIFLATFSSVILTIRGDDVPIGACAIKNDENYLRPVLKSILPKEVDDVNLNFAFNLDFTGNLVVSKTSPDGLADVRKESGLDTYSFFLTEEFKDFDSKTGKLDSNVTDLKGGTFSFICDEDDTTALIDMVYSQNVRDTNNNPPTFNQPSYEILVPMPLLPKYDITALLDGGIIATDLDFSEQMVTFTIDDPRFALETKSDPTSKDYTAVLKTIQPFSLTEDSTFTITATDSGNPPRPATASLTIKVDAKNSVGVLSFSSALFTMTYSEDDGKPTLGGLDPSPIHITTPNPEGTKVIISAGNEGGEFDANFDTSTSEVTVTVGKALTSDLGVVTLKLSASSEATTVEAVININLPVDAGPATPKFSQAYYEASYQVDPDNKAVVTVTGEGIKLTDGADGAVVTLSGDFVQNFVISKNPDNAEYTLSVAADHPLDESTLLKNDKIVVVLQATLKDVSTLATVIVTLPPKSPEFEKTLYLAKYTVTSDTTATVDFDAGSELKLQGENNGKDIQATGTYADNFKLDYDTATESYKVTVSKVLDPPVLTDNSEIFITIQTSLPEAVKANEAQILLKLPAPTKDILPKLDKRYYTGSYLVNDGLHTLTVDDIKVVSEEAETTVVEVEGDFGTNFNCKVKDASDPTTWTLEILNHLDQALIDEHKDLLVVLKATLPGSIGEASASVLISLPEGGTITKNLKFTENFYSAKYELNENKPSLNVDNLISVAAPDASTATVEFKDGPKKNFMVEKSKDGDNWVVSVDEPLDDEQLKQNPLVLELVARQANSIDGGATLVIQVPTPEGAGTITFKEPFYQATYKNDGDKPEIVVTGQITLTDHNAVVSVTSEYDVFALTCDGEGKCTLTTTGLPDDVLQTKKEIMLIIEAAVSSDSAIKGKSTVILDLPLKTDEKVPKFTNAIYEANYTESNGKGEIASPEIKLDPQELADNISEMTVDDDNFQLNANADGTSWVLQLKDGTQTLPTGDKNVILLKLTVKLKDTPNEGTSSIIVNLPLKTDEKVPKFTSDIYETEYTEYNGKGQLASLEIKLATQESPDNILGITVDDDVNFQLKANDDGISWVLQLKDGIEKLPTEDKNVILLKLTVKLNDTEKEGTSAVIVKLPKKYAATAIEFSSTVYHGKYVEGNPTGSVDITEEIKVVPNDDVDLTKVTVDLQGENKDNFDRTFDQTTGLISLTLKSLPDGALDLSILQVDISAKLDVDKSAVISTVVIELPANNQVNPDAPTSDDTGLVAGIAVLAVLLVGFIVGTGVIYFIKRKRSQTYNDLDDFRYEKNAKANDSISRVDPPKRRPTGVIRYELDNETEGPADTDVDAPIEPNNNAERRKSVVFDENVETLPIESRDERVSDEEENAEDEDGDDASEKSDRNDDSDQEKDVDTST